MDFHISSIFILISFLASLTLFFQKGISPHLKLFPVFLIVAFWAEIVGTQLSERGYSNVLFFSFFTAIEFEFYFYILMKIIWNRKAKRIINKIIIVYPFLVLTNSTFFQIGTFNTVTYALGCLLVVILCIYYFFELFRLPKYPKLVREPSFWICSALLFFYCCSFPLFGLMNYLDTIAPIFIRNLSFILMYLNVLLYSLFAVAFLCRFLFRVSEKNK